MFIKRKIVNTRVGGATSVEYMLDDLSLPTPTFAYSLRKLTEDYTGSCIRIRRQTDDAEQDIGFGTDGGIDEGAITSFAGTASAYVRTWYDQSGNVRDAEMTTNTRQPRIVDSGSLDTLGSENKPTIFFDHLENSVGSYLTTPSIDMANGTTAGGTTAVCSLLSTGGTGQVGALIFQFPGTNWGIGIGDVNSSTGYYDGRWRYTNSVRFSYNDICHTLIHRGTSSGQGYIYCYNVSDGDQEQTFIGGTSNESSQVVTIGNFQLNDNNSRRDFVISEVIHWSTSSVSASQYDIATSSKDWYGT